MLPADPLNPVPGIPDEKIKKSFRFLRIVEPAMPRWPAIYFLAAFSNMMEYGRKDKTIFTGLK